MTDYSGTSGNQKNGLFSSMANPVIRKMRKNADYAADSSTASYGGIAGKTVFFLLVTVAGVLAYMIIHNLLLNSGAHVYTAIAEDNGFYNLSITMVDAVIVLIACLISIITPFLAWLIRPSIPVTGTLYAVSQGVIVGFIVAALRDDLKWIGILAAVITIALVAVMLFIYAKRIITVTARFRGIITGIFATIVIGGIIYFILNLIPATRVLMTGFNSLFNNPVISIILSILFILIALFFMLADFDTIEYCVSNGMDKKYEWMAAWGLAYTILYVYFKILRLLLMIFGNSKSSSSRKF